MRPEHKTRLAIIREWMSLPKDKRQSEQQAAAFAMAAVGRVPSIRNPHQRIMAWLSPRIGKA
jgi:hypothetical protein